MPIVSQGNSVVVDVGAHDGLWIKSTGSAEVTINQVYAGTPDTFNVTTDVLRVGFYGEPVTVSIRAVSGIADYQSQQFSIQSLTAVQDGDRTDSSPLDVKLAVNAIESRVDRQQVVWLGLDSLTAGSGGFCYDIVLEKLARGVVGWGGRWVPFGDATTWGETAIFKSGVTTIASLPMSDARRNRGLDGNGVFAPAGADANMSLIPSFNWFYADVYYLQQPGGGSFTIDRPTGQTAVNVNTNGPLSLQKVRITKNLLNGTGTENNFVRIRNAAVAAEFVAYGVMFYSNDSGPCYVNVAQGGRKTSDQLLFDEVFQRQWFAMLGVNTVVLNAGMNDRSVSSAATFQADLLSVIKRFPSDARIVIQTPNRPVDNQLDKYDPVYPAVANAVGASLIDTVAIFGDYAAFNGRGWMLDGVHPNQHYQIRQAQEACKTLFGNSRYENTPAVINYVGGDPQ